MTTQPSFIIVGGGLAGAIAAQTLREEGFDGRITLLGEEPHRPYERPPLSKDYLQGKADRDSIFAHPEPWYADHAVELRLGTAVISLDPTARTVTTATGVQLSYDKLLLTTGSTPRRLSVPGPTSTACATCAASMTVSASRLGSPRRTGLPSSAPAGSDWRLRPPPATQG
jgi:3-phenylpropionate/trans-cinnamate dioxygenase ferredoxin reductase subunit